MNLEEIKKIILRIISILLFAFFPCAGLLMVYFYTSPKIAEHYEIKEKRAVLDVFQIPYKVKEASILGFPIKQYDKQNIREVFSKNITVEETEDGKKKLFKYIKNGELQGIGFVVSKTGYGYNKSSPITLFICLKPDLETLKGIEVLDHGETPGLGGRITEDEFKRQFAGKKLKPRLRLVKGAEAKGPNEVNAITGATNTSKGIESLLNDTVKEFLELQRKTKIW